MPQATTAARCGALAHALAALSVVLTAERSQGQGSVPAVDTWPRTRAEWQAERERSWQKPAFRVALAEKAYLLDAMLARYYGLEPRFGNETLVYDEGLADDLIGELYLDQGHPALNRMWQEFVVNQIADVARWPEERLPAEARCRLTDGLLQYAAGGGGRAVPGTEAELASALDRLAPDELRVQAVMEDLLLDALAWAEAVESDIYLQMTYQVAEDHWGDSFVLRALEARAPVDIPLDRRPAKYTEAVAALEALLADPPPRRSEFARKVEAASELALRDMAEESLNADLTSRLLLVYQRLLARRPMIPERISDYIDRRLFRLAAHADRLKTDEHWRLWCKAVGELGRQRISKPLKNHVRSLLEKKDLPEARRKAFEPLRALIAE